MSIFKDTFKEGVKSQLKIRQNAILDRKPDSIQYFNARNAWIRMTSSVNVGGSNDSAKRHVMQGGVRVNTAPNEFNLRSGIGTTNVAYSTQTPDGQLHRLGIRPMPGITSIDVKSKSAYGSLREVTVNFQCWDIRQLEELELLYMRPGYTVLIEWGWAPYLDNNGKLKNDVSPYNTVLYGGKSKETIWKELFEKSSTDGNYDALYGFIKNYSWSARPDGGYDCTTTIISMGEILESLKINYTPADSPIASNGVFGTAKLFGAADWVSNLISHPISGWFSDDEGNVKKSYSQNIIAGICNELYRILKDSEGIEDKTEKQFGGWTFFRFDVEIEGSPNSENDFDDSTQIYILLKDFVDILNRYVLLQDSKGKSPIFKVSVFEGDHMGGTDKPLLCLGHPLQLFTNPSVCLIKNDAWLNPSSLGFDEGSTDDFSTLKEVMSGLKTSYWYNNDYTNQQLGVIGNIYVNLGYIFSLTVDKNLEAQDKKEKNDIVLFDFLKNLMSGINSSIGNVATFEIFSDPIDSAARIIDVNYTDSTNRNEAYNNSFQFEIQNTKSVVRNYKLESQIFPEQSSIIAIGAQAQGGALGSDVNTLIDFNQNLIDRIIPKKDSPYNVNNENEGEKIKEQVKNLKENIKIITSYINDIDPNWYNLFGSGNFNVENAAKYNNALKDLINFYKTLVKNDNKNRSLIPTKLSLETDGIGGIIIGNLFRIPDEILPKGYKGGGAGPSKIAYVVTGLGHSIQNNDWKTNIDAQFIILDEPKEGLSITDISAIKIINKAVQKEPIEKATKIIDQVKTDVKTKTQTKEKGSGCVAIAPDLSLISDSELDIIKGTFTSNTGDVQDLAVVDGRPMARDVAKALLLMKRAAAKDKIDIRASSGFRSPYTKIQGTSTKGQKVYASAQDTLYKAYLAGKGNLAAKPGASPHGYSIALDLNTGSVTNPKINSPLNKPRYQWLINNAYKFGFVRYVYKEEWHWQYMPGTYQYNDKVGRDNYLYKGMDVNSPCDK